VRAETNSDKHCLVGASERPDILIYQYINFGTGSMIYPIDNGYNTVEVPRSEFLAVLF